MHIPHGKATVWLSCAFDMKSSGSDCTAYTDIQYRNLSMAGCRIVCEPSCDLLVMQDMLDSTSWTDSRSLSDYVASLVVLSEVIG